MADARAERSKQAGSQRCQPEVRRAPTSVLSVGAVDDPAEREADSIAQHLTQLLAQPASALPGTATGDVGARIRRSSTNQATTSNDRLDEADPDGEEEPVRTETTGDATSTLSTEPSSDGTGPTETATSVTRSLLSRKMQRPATTTVAIDEADQSLSQRIQRSATAGHASDYSAGTGASGGPLDAEISQRIQRSLGGGRALDASVRDRVQPAFGTDLAAVRIHADIAANTLSREINARAFTVGRDVFFGKGEYQPGSTSGMKLLAHELGHVGQQTAGSGRSARRTVIRRRFEPAVALSDAHLRAENNWSNPIGPTITAGTQLFVDEDPATRIVQTRKVLKNVSWKPAVNVDPANPVAATGNQIGYIRSSRAMAWGNSEKRARSNVTAILRDAEKRIPNDAIKDKLTKPKHVDFLLKKAVRLDQWNPATGGKGPTFGAGIGTLNAKYDRINKGAEHVADTLAHWRNWLHPAYPTLVDILEVDLVESDLHEHGLGVMMVKFRKPMGGAAMFAGKTIVEAVIKPEDKSLEKALLGSQPTSAANQANQLAGLTGNQKLGTLNMEVANVAPVGMTPVWSTLVERVQGKSSEDLVQKDKTKKGRGGFGVIPAFHETLVFAWLAGIDDLHWENVMWVNDVPYLIDADSAMASYQMDKDEHNKNQTGFSTVNKKETDDTKEGIKKLDPVAAKSKLLAEIKKSTATRDAILLSIKQAIAGRTGRTVPIYTKYWADVRDLYQRGGDHDRSGLLDQHCMRKHMVGDTRKNMGEGPGLQGTTGINPLDDFYDPVAVRAQLKKDMDAAVIPFFEYHYDTGFVTYNGVKIFHGVTIDQAFAALTAQIG